MPRILSFKKQSLIIILIIIIIKKDGIKVGKDRVIGRRITK